MMRKNRRRRRAPFAGATVAVLLLVTGCGGATDVPAEPAAAPSDATEEPAAPEHPDEGAGTAAASDPRSTAEAVAAVAMPLSEARDPFEPVRDPTDTAVETSAADGSAVPAAPPAAATPTDVAPSPTPAPVPTPEPSAGTCDADLEACLSSLRLLDAGPGTDGPAIFQLGTTLYEVEPGAGFADAFILLRIEGACATVAHRDGAVQRCVEPDSSLK